jgi:hypothetical protein
LGHEAPALPIVLTEPVPQAALLGGAADALETDLTGTGGLWWHGGGVSASRWPARLGGTDAVPTDPNSGQGEAGRLGTERGLRCRAGIHCGFVAQHVAGYAAKAVLAIRWATPPGEEARTLLTLNTGGAARKSAGKNYLFLSEADGVLTVQDDAGQVALTTPCPARATPHLAIVALAGDRVTLDLDGARATATATTQVLDGAASLFIAARNQRPKLFKTLGAALILDVWLWPGRGALDGTEIDALRRYHLWAGA